MATHMRLRRYSRALTLALLCALAATAEGQWVVTVTPRNPLVVGACGQVGIKAFDPKVKGTPRTPAGHFVSTAADFDMKVESSNKTAVVGRYESASIWVACACLSAVPGSQAVVTATYPAKALPDKLRVPDVTAQGTATFSIVAPSRPGSFNPPGCAALQLAAPATTRAGETLSSGAKAPISTTVPITARPPVTTSSGGPTAPPPETSTPRPTESTGSGSVAAGRPTSSGSIAGGTLGSAVPTAGPAVAGPAPTNLRVLPNATPIFQELWWDRPAGVSGYNAFLKPSQSAAQWTQLNDALLTTEDLRDSAIRAPGTVYRVTAIYPDGRQGSTELVYSNPPPLAVPTGFKVRVVSPGQVELSWVRVPYAKSYRVMGSGRPADGTVVTPAPYASTADPITTTIQYLSPGTYTWQVTADYGGAYETAGLPSATITLYSNRYRVSILGLKAIAETNDDQLSRDGKDNEVYAAAVVCTGLVAIASRANVPFPDCNLLRSAVHGDVNGFPGRIKAGSGSGSGGITAGDVVGLGPSGSAPASTVTFPFLLWEGELFPDSQAVWIAPSLWEFGGSDSQLLDWPFSIRRILLGNAVLTTGPTTFNKWGFSNNALNSPGFAPINPGTYERCTRDKGNDRAIGLSPAVRAQDPPSLLCNVIGLTYAKAESVLRGSAEEPGNPVGVVTMDLNDAESGHYVMYLKLERVNPPPVTNPIVK